MTFAVDWALNHYRSMCSGAVALAEYVADSFHLLRLDLRENDIKTAGLMALSLALKVNESVTRMDVDKETKKESVSLPAMPASESLRNLRCQGGIRVLIPRLK